MRVTVTVDIDPPEQPRLDVVIGPVRDKENDMIGPIDLLDYQKVLLTIAPRNAKKPAPLDGVPEWSTSDANVISVTPAANGMSCTAVAGATGSATVTVTADAKIGVGVTQLTETFQFNVIAGEATSLGGTVGTPEDQ